MHGRYEAQQGGQTDAKNVPAHGERIMEDRWRESMSQDRLTMHNGEVLRCVWSDDLSRSMDPARGGGTRAIAESDRSAGQPQRRNHGVELTTEVEGLQGGPLEGLEK